jgi:hypothetical protein
MRGMMGEMKENSCACEQREKKEKETEIITKTGRNDL